LIRTLLGQAKERLGKDPRPEYLGAVASCEKAIELGGPAAQLNTNLGQALACLAGAQLVRGEEGVPSFERALAAFEETIRLDPRLAFAHTNKVIILTRLGRFEEASLAIRSVEEYAKTTFERSKAAHSMRIVEYALEAAPFARNLLRGHRMFDIGAFREARPHYEKALELAAHEGIDKDPKAGAAMGSLNLRYATILSLASAGRSAPLAPSVPISKEDTACLKKERSTRLSCPDGRRHGRAGKKRRDNSQLGPEIPKPFVDLAAKVMMGFVLGCRDVRLRIQHSVLHLSRAVPLDARGRDPEQREIRIFGAGEVLLPHVRREGGIHDLPLLLHVGDLDGLPVEADLGVSAVHEEDFHAVLLPDLRHLSRSRE
jgi:tetratricopeptide (TPR) repeat protein